MSVNSAQDLLEKKEINGEELEYLIKERKENRVSFLLIDVREEYEFNEKHILGVDYLLPLSDFFNQVKRIEKDKSRYIIAKCKLGGRSARAQMYLRQMGFKNVINLAGGIINYKGATT